MQQHRSARPTETLGSQRPPAATRCHPACVACRSTAEGGLGLHFQVQPGGAVSAPFDCTPVYRSYEDRVNGGMVALLMDAAMAHCLFHHGLTAVTGRLNVGYREPLAIGTPAELRAWLVGREPGLLHVRAEIRQAGRVKARADGKFAPREADAAVNPPSA